MSHPANDGQTCRLIELAAGGDQQAWAELLDAHRLRLRRMVALRLDPRLRGRVDPSDVIQEAWMEASRRLPEYRSDPTVSFYLWLRYLVSQHVIIQHRHHLGTAMRDVRREVQLRVDSILPASTDARADQLLDKLSSPSDAAQSAEEKAQIQLALDAMNPLDREIIILRNHEQLTNGEAAQVLGLDKSATSKRYIRALIHLKDILAAMDIGGSEGGSP